MANCTHAWQNDRLQKPINNHCRNSENSSIELTGKHDRPRRFWKNAAASEEKRTSCQQEIMQNYMFTGCWMITEFIGDLIVNVFLLEEFSIWPVAGFPQQIEANQNLKFSSVWKRNLTFSFHPTGSSDTKSELCLLETQNIAIFLLWTSQQIQYTISCVKQSSFDEFVPTSTKSSEPNRQTIVETKAICLWIKREWQLAALRIVPWFSSSPSSHRLIGEIGCIHYWWRMTQRRK